MATEIELKAHVEHSETLRRLLDENAEYLYAFEKTDTYWSQELPSGRALRLRVRNETREFPDGRAESCTFATRKNKEIRDGIEINDEREFTVSPAAEFEEFLTLAGLRPETRKRKRGRAYSRGEITAELLEVPPLGWFLELEIVAADCPGGVPPGDDITSRAAESAAENAFAEASEKILSFLDALGIARGAIESRFYSEMLKADG